MTITSYRAMLTEAPVGLHGNKVECVHLASYYKLYQAFVLSVRLWKHYLKWLLIQDHLFATVTPQWHNWQQTLIPWICSGLWDQWWSGIRNDTTTQPSLIPTRRKADDLELSWGQTLTVMLCSMRELCMKDINSVLNPFHMHLQLLLHIFPNITNKCCNSESYFIILSNALV